MPATKNLVKPFTPLSIDDTFRIAAALYSCYRYCKATQNKQNIDKVSFDDGDMVIRACAFRYNCAILTANGNDFPRPFFDEQAKYTIHKKSNKAEISVQLLSPDFVVLNEYIKECL